MGGVANSNTPLFGGGFSWLKVFLECLIYISQGSICYMANVILTPQTWVNVSLIGGKVVVNSRWLITLYHVCTENENQDNL